MPQDEFKRRFYLGRILIAIAISALIYVMIFSFANWVSYQNQQGVSEKNKFVQDSLDEFEKALSNVSCDSSVLVSVSEKLDQVGASLGLLEMRLGKKDSRVLEQKKTYSELEKRHFELIKKMDEQCNSSFVTLLFFYSNELEQETKSEIAGTILTTFKRRAPSKVMVYSFDNNLDSDAIEGLKAEYFVDTTPYVLVNERDMIVNLENIAQLEGYLS